MNSSTCLIIAGAPDCHIPENGVRAGLIIACDYGLQHALDSGLMPHLVIGDFDSYQGTVPDAVPVRRMPPEKDDTDTMLAVKEALDRGFRSIVIAGGLGGRIDHEFANITAAAYAAEHGARAFLVDAHHQIFLLKNETCRIARGKWRDLSIFSFSDRSEGVTLKGVKYPFTEGTMKNTFPLGVSNAFSADTAEVSVREGMLLVILTDFDS